MNKNSHFPTAGVLFITALCLIGCSNSKQPAATDGAKLIKFDDVGWDSIKFHNAVARIIVESAFGYKTEEVSGSTPITYPALKKGDIDVLMEMWTDNVPTYDKDIANKELLELGVNFKDDAQGVYVPRYVIQGDKKRGIKPMAPDLKKVADLARYKDLFADPETPGKGRLYGAVAGWNIDKVLHKKYEYLGLNKTFTYFAPGSDAALAAVFTSAIEKGRPVAGYYWEPTWLTGKYDMVRLADEPYNAATFNDGIGDFPAVRVTICATNSLQKRAPEVVEFLRKYSTSSELTSAALAYMFETKADYNKTAKWFLQKNDKVWTQWLSPEKVALVKAAIK
jgi:ABC-type proline/glycine betaine transport system substrate-binding protein